MAEEQTGASIPSTGATEASDAPPYSLSMEKQFIDTIIFLGLLFAIFYFILIRPQQKRIKEHETMMKGLKKGTRVVTGGGILGTVSKVDDTDVVQVEIAPGVKVSVAKGSIAEVVQDKKAASETANDN